MEQGHTQHVQLGVKSDRWDLTRYLVSMGMSEKEAEIWIQARKEGKSFTTNSVDGSGGHLDNLWRRNQKSVKSASTGQLRMMGGLGRVISLRMILMIFWAFSISAWMYVVALQIMQPNLIYAQIAWLSIRTDYFGEAAFIASFAFAVLWMKITG
jgi:hypothetical protein